MFPPAGLDRLLHADSKSLVLKLLEGVGRAAANSYGAARRDRPAQRRVGATEYQTQRHGQGDRAEAAAADGRRRAAFERQQDIEVFDPRGADRQSRSATQFAFPRYANFVVQHLVIRPHVVNFRCERWQTPDGEMLTASLPAGIHDHFGPELRRFVLAQYHQRQVKMPRLLALLRGFGIVISKRQVVRLLIADQDSFTRAEQRCAARRTFERPLVHGRRHGGPPQSGERRVHSDRQCEFRLVRHHRLEEPQ
jgi:hypothetical protein